jgi:hypothetical protein
VVGMGFGHTSHKGHLMKQAYIISRARRSFAAARTGTRVRWRSSLARAVLGPLENLAERERYLREASYGPRDRSHRHRVFGARGRTSVSRL